MPEAPPRTPSTPPLPELAHTLTALPEFGLRLGWLKDYADRHGPARFGFALDALATAALSGEPRSREALLAAGVFLAIEYKSPLIDGLREVAQVRALLGLDRLVRPRPDDEEHACVDLPIPRYAERELSLGERRSLARRPTRLQLEKLVLDPDPLVLTQLLQCPALTELDVLSIATHRRRPPSTFEALAEAPRWIARSRLRHAIVQNPRAPHALALPLVSTLLREDLVMVQTTTTVNPVLRLVATELLERSPPFGSDSPEAAGENGPH